MMIKMASVYERLEHWYVWPSSQTTTGLWIGMPPIFEIDKKESYRRKCDALFQALKESKDSIPVPEDGNALDRPFLEATGTKSWSEFLKKAQLICVELEKGQLTIIPYEKVDRKGRMHSIREESITISADADPEEIGRCLEEAFSRCR